MSFWKLRVLRSLSDSMTISPAINVSSRSSTLWSARRSVIVTFLPPFTSTTLFCRSGSVLSTGRYAEGTTVGFNRTNRGTRSYYPLFCTVAQTDQVLDVPGNVYDSNGADGCVRSVRESLPRARIEVRIYSVFFNRSIIQRLHCLGVTFSVPVPFERFAELKAMVEGRRRWRYMAGGLGYFESRWKPKSWNRALSLHLHQKSKRCDSTTWCAA